MSTDCVACCFCLGLLQQGFDRSWTNATMPEALDASVPCVNLLALDYPLF